MSALFSARWLKDATERAVKTFAQALLAVLGATTFDWWKASWQEIIGSAGLAAAVSVLTSVVSAGVNPVTSISPASVVPEERTGDDRGAGEILIAVLVVGAFVLGILWARH